LWRNCSPSVIVPGYLFYKLGNYVTMTRQRGAPAIQGDFLASTNKLDNALQFGMDRSSLFVQLTFKMDAIQPNNPLAFCQIAESCATPKLEWIPKRVGPPDVNDNLTGLWVPGTVPPAICDAN
jgi:hypothetical protein